MTVRDHEILYEELKQVIFGKSIKTQGVTDAQKIFIRGLEESAFGVEFLKAYAELVSQMPDINLRNLHAYCVGFGLGKNLEYNTDNETYH